MGKWTKGRIRLDRTRAGRAIVSECNRTIAAAHLLGGSHTEAEADANAERIIACWNAMTGIEDPAAFMAEVREFASAVAAIAALEGLPSIGDDARALLAKMEGK